MKQESPDIQHRWTVPVEHEKGKLTRWVKQAGLSRQVKQANLFRVTTDELDQKRKKAAWSDQLSRNNDLLVKGKG